MKGSVPPIGIGNVLVSFALLIPVSLTSVETRCSPEDLAGPLASALKLLPSKRSHVVRAGYSAAGAELASAMRSAADLQAIPDYSDFPLHSMRKVQETPSHRIHTVRFAKLERHKIQKYNEGVRNAAGMLRFVPFATIFEFGSLAPHAEAFLVELAKAGHTHTLA
eukprot:jgi/Tetstr1/460137/TSEL_005453.t1